MKTILVCLAILSLMLTAGSTVLWAQTARMEGTVKDNDKPLAGVQVILKSKNTGKEYKMKADKNGSFMAIGISVDSYDVTVVDSSGKTIYTHENLRVGQSGDDNVNLLSIDLTKGTNAKTPQGASVGQGVGSGTQKFAGEGGTVAKGGSKGTDGSTVNKEEVERVKAANVKAEGINALIGQYNAALTAKDWKAAITPLQGMIAADPARWEYFQALGNAQLNDGDFDDSIKSYDQGIQVAQGYVSGATPKDPKNPNSDPAKAKAGMGQMYASEGTAYLKLNKKDDAIAAYTKAAEMDPNPAVAYFNICATQYNVGNMAGATAACDKAIAVDPNKADAYFIKGSSMYGDGKLDSAGKYTVPPGTAEALNKYLELAPDGAHAADVKAMLEAIGAKIETSYGKTKKK